MREAEEELWAGGKRHWWGEMEGVFRGGGVSGEKQLKTVRTDAGESTVRAERAEPQENQIRQNKGTVRLSERFEETFSPWLWVFMAFQTNFSLFYEAERKNQCVLWFSYGFPQNSSG